MGPFDRANVRRSREAFVPCSSVAVTRTLVTSRRLLKFADAGAPAHTRASVSDSSGVSYFLWYVAWSPTTTTTGTPARLALCRLATPLTRVWMSAWASFTTTTYAPRAGCHGVSPCRHSGLGDRYAAVDDDGLAGDVTGGVGSKPDNSRG